MAYTAITIEGGLFPADLLEQLAAGEASGQRTGDFGLAGRRLSDEIQAAFSDVHAYWQAFQRRRQHSRKSATTITRDAWIIPFLERLGFDLTFQRSAQVGGETYAISHRAGGDPMAPPVHIAAMGQELDRRGEGMRRSPHALVQEYLNHSDALWGITTNGDRLRLLRDSTRVSRPTYVELDLRAMVESNLYSDFAVCYRLLHRTRFPHAAADAHECLLERYFQEGIDAGGRVRARLRDGVEAALQELGSAFLAHPDNEALRWALQSGQLSAAGYYRQLLRLVYRLLFLFVAEERKLVLPAYPSPPDPLSHKGRGGETSLPDALSIEDQTSPSGALSTRWKGGVGGGEEVYTQHYSVARLRERCERCFTDDRWDDLWVGLRYTFLLFRDQEAAGRMGLTALNGELFGAQACPDLEEASCENARLLRAVYHLSTFADGGVRRRVNYAGLDVEELGSVYESLLDYQPHVELDGAPRFELVAGSERRQTGSYYTPPELVRGLVEHALVPVMEERLAQARTAQEKEQALLRLRVCDPASGSGHFLLAAARRIGRELARVRTGEGEPPPEKYREAVRDVIRTCLYAVDKNPLAVDLCKVALWMEGHNAGLPLSFLDHHVKCGDSLVGVADLSVLEEGIPDEAYKRSDKEEAKVGRRLRDQNRREREYRVHQLTLDGHALDEHLLKLGIVLEELERTPDDSPRRVAEKAARYEAARGQGSNWWVDTTACHMWTAPFFLDLTKTDPAAVPTTGGLLAFLENSKTVDARLAGTAWEAGSDPKHPFFHWPLEFPDVLVNGRFDVVLGNPPFMGGLRISELFGELYRSYLGTAYAPAPGIADLCAYFFRRAFTVLRRGGHFGLVATNSIGQGDTREAGLAVIVRDNGTISFARRFVKWLGAANVEVNLVSVRKGNWMRQRRLGARPTPLISSRLDDEPEAEPSTLKGNEGQAYIGSYLRGDGFILEPDEAERLIAASARNRDCLFPYLNGEDLNSRPDQSPSRWAINFFDWPLERAKRYPDLLKIVEARVKPQRDKVKQSNERERWWLFARLRGEMHDAIRPLSRVLIRSEVSEQHMLRYLLNNPGPGTGRSACVRHLPQLVAWLLHGGERGNPSDDPCGP